MSRPPSSTVTPEKFEQRRAELSEATRQTLANLGYARTSLRENAQNSAYSHGVLHYYFSDKLDLILCSVRHYKARCVRRYDEVVAGAGSYEGLLKGFADALGKTLRDEAALHRLWYDLRSQAMFEEAFRADVGEIDKSLEKMIWRVVSRLGELSGRPVECSPGLAYSSIDGVFEHALLRHHSGDRRAVATLRREVDHLVRRLVPAPDAGATGRQTGSG